MPPLLNLLKKLDVSGRWQVWSPSHVLVFLCVFGRGATFQASKYNHDDQLDPAFSRENRSINWMVVGNL